MDHSATFGRIREVEGITSLQKLYWVWVYSERIKRLE